MIVLRQIDVIITKLYVLCNILNDFYYLYVYTVAPKPAFKPVVEKKEIPTNPNFTEIHFTTKKGETVDVGMLCVFLYHSMCKAYDKITK